MSNIIQIKSGTLPPPDGALENFELGYVTNDGCLYIGVDGETLPVKVKMATDSLPLTGGTLTGYLHLDGTGIILRGYSSGEWARGMNFQDEGATTRASIGAFGTGSSLSYVYLGESYSSTNSIRIYPGAGTPRVGTNDILHAGNYTSYKHSSLEAATANYSNTNFGYILFGPQNANWAHIYTDRPSFYFNKPLVVSGTSVSMDGHTHSYAASSHNHSGANITSGTVPFARLPTGTGSSQVAIGNHTHSYLATSRVARGVTGTINNATWSSVSYGKTLPAVPSVVATGTSNVAGASYAKIRNRTTTGFEIIIGGTGTSNTFNWIAIAN